VFEGTWSWQNTPVVASGALQEWCAAAPERQKPPAQPGVARPRNLRCPKAKRSQAVKGGPSGPSEGSRAAAPLTAWGAELGRSVWRTRSPEGPDARILSNGGAPRAC